MVVFPAGPQGDTEIAEARGVPIGQDCVSPATHSAFSNPLEMMRFIERLRRLSGAKPVGFKFCMGHVWEWFAMVKAMRETGIWPDFIVVDGAEGGHRAAPSSSPTMWVRPAGRFADGAQHLAGLNERHRVKPGCAGKVIGAFDMARMMALGADWQFGTWLHVRAGVYSRRRAVTPGIAHRGDHTRSVSDAGAGGARQDRAGLPLPPQHDVGAKANWCRPRVCITNEITADHILRRVSGCDTRRLSNLLRYAGRTVVGRARQGPGCSQRSNSTGTGREPILFSGCGAPEAFHA